MTKVKKPIPIVSEDVELTQTIWHCHKCKPVHLLWKTGSIYQCWNHTYPISQHSPKSTPKRNKFTKRHAHSSTIHNGPKCLLTVEWISQNEYSYNRIQYSNGNKWSTITGCDMDEFHSWRVHIYDSIYVSSKPGRTNVCI